MNDLTNVLYDSFKQNIKIYCKVINIALSAQSILLSVRNADVRTGLVENLLNCAFH